MIIAQRFDKIIARLDRFPAGVLQFLVRFSVAVVFWNSGLSKIANWQTTVALFREHYAVPLLAPASAAYLTTAIELSCPVLLVLGLAARLATLPLLALTFVIWVFVYPEDWVEELTWATMLLVVLVRGPGAFSIDQAIARVVRPRHQA